MIWLLLASFSFAHFRRSSRKENAGKQLFWQEKEQGGQAAFLTGEGARRASSSLSGHRMEDHSGRRRRICRGQVFETAERQRNRHTKPACREHNPHTLIQ